MSIEGLKGYFPSAVRSKGAEYTKRVRFMHDDGEPLLHAHVRGSEDYCIKIERDGHRIAASCSCPYFESSGPCKHLWAVLSYAQQFGDFDDGPALSELRALDELSGPAHAAPARTAARGMPRSAPPEPGWRDALATIERTAAPPAFAPGAALIYILDLHATLTGRGVAIDVATRTRTSSGDWSKPRAVNLPVSSLLQIFAPHDRAILPMLAGLAQERVSYSYQSTPTLPSRCTLPVGAAASLIARMSESGQLHLRVVVDGKPELWPMAWDDGPPYSFHLSVRPHEQGGGDFLLRGQLRRDGETRDLGERMLTLVDGLVLFRDRAARLAITPEEFQWIPVLAQHGGSLRIPAAESDALIAALHALPHPPPLDLPEALRVNELRVAPRPALLLRSPPRGGYSDKLVAALHFDYAGIDVDSEDPRRQVLVPGQRALAIRDSDQELAAVVRLRELGFRLERPIPEPDKVWVLPPRKLGEVVPVLIQEGWRVEADGKAFRAPGAISIAATSGIDWFDVSGDVAYGELHVSLPKLLQAAQRGERYLRLDDGTFGVLPEEWLARHRLLHELGSIAGDALRFRRNQIGLLDALLAAMPEAKADAVLTRAREALTRFSGVIAADAPAGFVGTLREYQREGLGWLGFLRDFGFGGCLADDMGLGKTIQVLALLASRRRTKRGRGQHPPSLVVVPKSLIFNWCREAARFTPGLRVLEHHGAARQRSLANFGEHDLVVTTYGTLTRDAVALREFEFDYVVLDEAQAIKNARTEAAKAARLLNARHRLVLTGTPVENRLSDLWSLFEFTNPGMLGAAGTFKLLGQGELADDGARTLLARALRPFILRRTKQQVAPDLPSKTEQIIYCELDGAERVKYDELRAYYRATLLGLVDERGIERSKMHILEALLRLRQAACHPGLIDRDLSGEQSAKVSALVERLSEVIGGGHKALVFSQFTSLLAIVKRHLDAAGIHYEYLDGRTRDRQARVDRFQTDPRLQVFLVSLKAGGVGLNLTAAEYVFLLDPWWNPAVESQAIDRTHRIGQSRSVFAYRLIGRDTVEEKVLALQAKKKSLAEAIITPDNAILASIDREDLNHLLS